MTKLNVTEWYNLLLDEILHECLLVLLKWMEPGLNNSIFRLSPTKGHERPIISCHPRTDYLIRHLSSQIRQLYNNNPLARLSDKIINQLSQRPDL